MPLPPGWYPDPADEQTQRYWDGEQWQGASLPRSATPPAGPLPEPAPVAAPPAAVSTETTARPTATYIARLAPLHYRLAARIIDFAILIALNIVVNGWFVYQYLTEIFPVVKEATRRYEATGSFGEIAIPDRAQRLTLVITAIALLLWLAYEVPALRNTGQTLGKRLLRISVVDLSTAGTPRFGPAFRRWAVLALPLVFPPVCAAPLIMLNSAWCLWDRPARQCIHDKFARTIVIRADDPAPQEQRP